MTGRTAGPIDDRRYHTEADLSAGAVENATELLGPAERLDTERGQTEINTVTLVDAAIDSDGTTVDVPLRSSSTVAPALRPDCQFDVSCASARAGL